MLSIRHRRRLHINVYILLASRLIRHRITKAKQCSDIVAVAHVSAVLYVGPLEIMVTAL